MLLRKLNCGVCRFNSYFTCITKSLLLLSKGWSPESYFSICHFGGEVVAYKPVANKKVSVIGRASGFRVLRFGSYPSSFAGISIWKQFPQNW